MTTQNFRVRKGLTIDGTTSGSSSFASTATGTDLSYVLPGSAGAASTVLTNDGSGNLSWDATGNPFDQSLNTTDYVEFAGVKSSIIEVDELRPFDSTTTNVSMITTGIGTYQTGKSSVTVTESASFPDGLATIGVNSNIWYFADDGRTQFPNYTFPAADGTANQVLTTDGSGNVSWALPGGGGSTFGNVTVGVATDQTISTTSGDLVLDSATNIVSVDAALQVGVAPTNASITMSADTTGIATTGITSTASDFTITHGGGTISGVNSYILLSGVTPAGYNGIWRVNATSAGSITVVGNANLGTASVQGTIYYGSSSLFGTSTNRVSLGTTSPSINLGSGSTFGQPSAINLFGNSFTIGTSYIAGQIRDTTTLLNGDTWSFLSGAANPVRGLSIDNSYNGAKRPAVLMRGLTNARPMLIGELNRGTTAVPLAVANNGTMLEIAGTGHNGTQYVTDAIAVSPISLSFTAAEAFTSPAGVNTANGSRLRVDAQPPGVTATAVSRSNIINHTATTATYRSDAWTFSTREVVAVGTNTTQLTLDSSGNAVLTGDLRVNGNDILSSTGATVMTMSTNDATFADAVQVNGILSSRSGLTYDMFTTQVSGTGATAENVLNLIKSDATGAANQGLINFATYRSSGGTYTPTLSGDKLGQFKFNGNTVTGGSPVTGTNPAVSIQGQATENWSNTVNGAKLVVGAVKNGGTASVTIIDHAPTAAVYKADTFTIEDSAGTDYLVLNSTSATFVQPVQFPNKTAAQWNAITGAVGMQVCVNDSPVNAGKMAYWDTTNARWSYVDSNLAI